MIRVVLDTNVVVSALLNPFGAPAEVLRMSLTGDIQLCVSAEVYSEYEEVLRRPRLRNPESIIIDTLEAIRAKGFWVSPVEALTACPDPADNVFLECAQAAHADCLVTGNLKHFPPLWEFTQAVNPRRLLEILHSGMATRPV